MLQHTSPPVLPALWLGGFHLSSHSNLQFISNHLLPRVKSFSDFPLVVRIWSAVSVTAEAVRDVTLVHSLSSLLALTF